MAKLRIKTPIGTTKIDDLNITTNHNCDWNKLPNGSMIQWINIEVI